MYLTSD